jgi:hypothetical protein
LSDSRRFHEFAKLIASNLPNRNMRILDVAGGKGYLQLSLREKGFSNIETWDPWSRREAIRGNSYHYKEFHWQTPERFDAIVALHPELWGAYNAKNWMAHLTKLASPITVSHTQISINGRNEVLILQ